MRPTHLDGIVFSQAEMVVLMHAVRPEDLVGIDSTELIPTTPEKHQAMIRAGIEELVARGLISIENGVHILNPELLLIARIVAFPEIVTILLKDIPEAGQQKFAYYQADQFVIEHTMPAAQIYRFATLPDVKAQIERMAFILPVQQKTGQPGYDVTLSQECFFQAREQVMVGALDAAGRMLRAEGLPAATVDALVHAMASPRFSGTVAYLKVEPPRVVDAWNIAFLQGHGSAWVILPEMEGRLHLQTITADDTSNTLFAGLQKLTA